MQHGQCPYFFASCPLVTVNNLPSPATPSDDPSRPSSSPLTPDFQPGNLASPWNSPHVKPSTQTCLVIPMPLNQYKAQMFKNQQDQLEGTKADVGEMRASTTSAFPTSSYIRPSLVINPSDTTMTSISSPSLPFSPEDGSQPWFSAELDSTFQHPSPTPSSSSNPFAFFTDPLDTPATYDTFYDAPLEFASSAFGQVEQQLPIAYDEPTSVTNQYHPPSSFSSFPYSPDPFAQYIGSFESFGDPEMAQAGASSSRESSPRERDASVLVVTSPPPSIERRTSESHLNDEMLGEQTAFISKLWHLITHTEYSTYLRWSLDGKSFVLCNPDEFASQVLPRFFRHNKTTSFIRQLNLYSFSRVSVEFMASPPHNPNGEPRRTVAPGFSHPNFNRDHPELLRQLHPRVPTKKPFRRSSASSNSPPASAVASHRRSSSSARGLGRS